MEIFGIKNVEADMADLGLDQIGQVHWNLSPEALVEASLRMGQGVLADNGALAIKTGAFTGRSPKDRFIVKDQITANSVDWGEINQPFSALKFDGLFERMKAFMAGKEVYVRDAFAGADPASRLSLRVVTELPWSNQFAYNMFIRPSAVELENFSPDWTVICIPSFKAEPAIDGTRQHNFSIINFTKKQILIGGTGYTGEIKKGIFSVLNYLLPIQHKVFPMHCSANVGKDGDTAIFFGLSGTGKTTLSADPDRMLIGDDEHGWSDEGVFNFEGGCYAKVIDLSEEKEPTIYQAIHHRAILENINFFPNAQRPDYGRADITQNSRVSYPLYHIPNRLDSGKGAAPKNIFFLSCDAFGVLPPISKLTPAQAMYYFISGYTAKVAGTEAGVDEPQVTFSACFGAPFMPLHPTQYAEMLGKKLASGEVNVWLVNTGWTAGPYGTGHRISLRYTRAMISAALQGNLAEVEFSREPVFGLAIPAHCPGVPAGLLNPRNVWEDKAAYDRQAAFLVKTFHRNFEQYADQASAEIKAAAPRLLMYS
ncbi:MAG: phosphoenolpyruvate carboxykinase (ATP) [Saprospiraceae bacterium]|nr:phosphoenolpyruvate carboxykinase (ATP) [Saprospiraceae bacterium]